MIQGIRPVPTLLLLATAATGAAASDRDARIESAARQSYSFKVHLKDEAIQVKSSGGHVTLTGTVSERWRRDLAEETVAGLPGVKGVDNQLVVASQAPPEASDAWLASKVRTALLFQRNVNASAIHVECRDGAVTLTGEAGSAAQVELAGAVARDVEGVKDVTTHIRILPASSAKPLSRKVDDASVTAQVKASLLFHRGTHLLTTKVKTDRGVVTVRGSASSAAEKDLVTRLVAGINGVKRVENRMTVER
jgi:osmotically-inducible protein OsmY